jgi:TolB-like protein
MILAISPFKNLMGKSDLDWMKEGFAETLTTKLNHVHRLKLVERVQFDEIIKQQKLAMADITEENASKVGKLLSADYIVIGSFQKQNSILKINSRVVNVETGVIEQGSAVGEKGEFASVFEIQEILATKIARQFGISLSDIEIQRMGIDETTSVTAYECYHQAKNETDPARKEMMLKKALEHDFNYAKAHLLLGSYYSIKAITDASLEKEALGHLNTALKLDAEFHDAHSALGDYYFRKSRILRQHMDAEEDEITQKALFHLNTFVQKKQGSKAKYYIHKVKVAQKKIRKLTS